MGLVTTEDVAAAQTEVDELRAAFPALPDTTPDGPLAALEAAAAVNHLAKLASTENGAKLRIAERKRQDVTALRARQLAAIEAHKAAETAMAARLAKMTTELEGSRQRLVQACSRGTLVDVGTAAREHDGLVRRLAAELRAAKFLLEEHDLEHDQGSIADGGHTGLRLADRWWLTVDPFLVVMWRANAEFAALFGADHAEVKSARDRFRLRLLDLRLDGLLNGVRLPKPGPAQSPWAAWVKRPNITDPMIVGDPEAALDRRDAEIDTKVPVGQRAFVRSQVRQQKQIVQAELAAAKGA